MVTCGPESCRLMTWHVHKYFLLCFLRFFSFYFYQQPSYSHITRVQRGCCLTCGQASQHLSVLWHHPFLDHMPWCSHPLEEAGFWSFGTNSFHYFLININKQLLITKRWLWIRCCVKGLAHGFSSDPHTQCSCPRHHYLSLAHKGTKPRRSSPSSPAQSVLKAAFKQGLLPLLCHWLGSQSGRSLRAAPGPVSVHPP